MGTNVIFIKRTEIQWTICIISFHILLAALSAVKI
nr:MAG TPA: hypothetical protein [Caudoviricetes sp.]